MAEEDIDIKEKHRKWQKTKKSEVIGWVQKCNVYVNQFNKTKLGKYDDWWVVWLYEILGTNEDFYEVYKLTK